MFKNFRTNVKRFFDAKLPFEILEQFKGVDSEYVENSKTFNNIDLNFIKLDWGARIDSIISLIISSISFIFFLLADFFVEDDEGRPVIIGLMVLSLIFVIYFSYQLYLNPKAHIILNRQDGIFSFPHGTNRNKSYTVPFHKAIVYWVGTGAASGSLGMKLVAQHPEAKYGGAHLIAHERDYQKIWSFYVWYMDRNRPLPPGTAFDPYRQQDFERRKAAGFPMPLYRSHIPTPEATPEQQAERNKYWKDHIEEFAREPHSIMYDPEVHTDWRRVRYMNKDDNPDSNRYYKYVFKNGDIVYMKTNEEGRGFMPPKSADYEETRLELVESWF